MLVAASSPERIGLSASPVREAVVSRPNPAPRAPAGMTALAAVYVMVVAVPSAMPRIGVAMNSQAVRGDTRNTSAPTAPSAAAAEMIARGVCACACSDGEDEPGHERHALDRSTQLRHIQRQDRPVAPVDDLQPENDGHQQDEVLEREHVPESHRLMVVNTSLGPHDAFVVHQEHDEQGDDEKDRGDEKRPPQTHHLCDHPADNRSDGRSEPLRGLHCSNRISRALPWRRLGSHRQGDPAIPGEQPLHGAKGEDVPGPARVRHSRHNQDEADQRPLDHDLPTKPIRHPAPRGRQKSGHRRRHAQAEAGPHRHLADILDAQLLQVQWQKRHHQREAGEANEARGCDGKNVALPG
jgi:hypothetical protein